MAKGIRKPTPPPRSLRLPFTMPDMARAAALVAVTILAYFPALNGGLLWDDDGHVTRPILRSLDGLRRIWFEMGATQQYYPLLHSAFWVEHLAWGDATVGYHLINVLLHAAGALLVVAIVRRLELPGAWIAGSIFALHPVCVEAVAWISEQKSTLSGVFYLAAAFVYLGFDQSRKRSAYVTASLLFVAALASKTVTASLPAALLVVFWWKRGRIDWKRDGLPLAPWFAVGAIAGLTTAWVERNYIGAQGASFSLGPVEHLLLAARMICFYAAKVVLPVGLMFFYPHWTVDASVGWQWLFLVAVVAVAGGLIWLARRERGPVAALMFFAGTLFPVLGFLNVYPFVYSWVADHFQYLATLGIIIPVAALLTRAPRNTAFVVPAILAILTWREARMYTNVETLYRESIARNPTSWIAHNNLANTLMDQPGKLPETISLLKTTLQLKPDSAEAHNNLGSAYTRMKDRGADSISEYQEALKLRPKFPQAETNLGSALLKQGKTEEAIAHFHTAIELFPEYADAHNNLGTALSKLPGRAQDAMAEYELALRLDPNSASIRNNIAGALAKTSGGLEAAIAQYRESIAREPNSARAQSNLGTSLSQAGQYPEALEHLRIALKLDPENGPAHSGMGVTLWKMGAPPADAMAEFQKALQLDPTLVDAHNNYGTMLAQANRVPEALAQFDAALQLDPNSSEAHANRGNILVDLPGRFAEAVGEYETAVKLQPAFAEGHFELGMALVQAKGKLPDAIQELETAIRLKPDFAEAHQNLALVLARDPKRLPEALAHFDAALKLHPDPETQALVDQLRKTGGR